MIYPLDKATVDEYFAHLLNNNKYQEEAVKHLLDVLHQALGETEDEDTYWQDEAQRALKHFEYIKSHHETRRFNERTAFESRGIKDVPNIPIKVGKTDDSLDEDELAEHFGEEKPIRNKKKDLEKNPDFKKMTMDEIEAWEEKQDNSNDIYKVAARVKNLARSSGVNLTPVGEMLANSFVHVLKDLYDFAETIPDKNIRIQFIEKVRSHEDMPGRLIAATTANMKSPEKK